MLASCGGGGGDDSAPPGGSFGNPGGGTGGSGGSGSNPPATVTISGRISYDFVPVAGGLNYNAIEQRPAQLIAVQFVDGATSAILASGQTDVNGDYSLDVPANSSGFVRARAEDFQSGTPGWGFAVVDNTSNGSVYTLDGGVLSSGSADSTRDLHAPSGWTGSSYGGERAAAPFAILDTLNVAVEYLLAADPAIVLPPLNINWSPNNVSMLDADGNTDPDMGFIGSSRYSSGSGIFLLGEEDTDTEEYDRHIVLHEFGHYLEDTLGRSDSIGGPHTISDRLDMRVAFSEGWATAFAALALNDPVVRDTGGMGQAGSFTFNVESDVNFPNFAPGFFSEQSVWELVWDLGDSSVDGVDAITYPFADLWSVTTGDIAATSAVTSVFPFLNGIKADHPGDAVVLDQIAAVQGIGSISTDYGDNESNNAGSADVLPVHAPLTVNDATPVNLCSTDEFTSGFTGAVNKLGAHRFIRFTPPADGLATITMTATSIPPGEFADPDFFLFRQGFFNISINQPDMTCQDVTAPGWVPGVCSESSTFLLTAEEYVIDIHEWTNTNDTDDPDFPPIGRTCFDVTVTQP